MLVAATLVLSLQPFAGWSEGHLDWTIADGLAPNSSPNILSELEFENIRSYSTGLNIELSTTFIWPELKLFAEGEGIYDFIERGSNKDTDYNGDNRTGVYSQSKSQIAGDNLLSLSGGFGLSYAVMPQRFTVAISGGGSHKEQKLNFRKGTQLIADPSFFFPVTINDLTASLQSLDSDYATEWQSSWVAGRITLYYGDIAYYARYQADAGKYYGEARWNLRANLKQPKSFTHHADSSGSQWELGLNYFLTQRVSMHFSWMGGEWKTDPGVDTTYFTDNSVQVTRFNGAVWKSSHYKIGVRIDI